MQRVMKKVVAILISGKIDFRTKNVIGEQERYFIMTRPAHQEYIKTYVNIYKCQNT